MLQHSKIHLVQHTVLYCGKGYGILQNSKFTLTLLTYLFRKQKIYVRARTFLSKRAQSGVNPALKTFK